VQTPSSVLLPCNRYAARYISALAITYAFPQQRLRRSNQSGFYLSANILSKLPVFAISKKVPGNANSNDRDIL
jgi:hypothetical protein